MPFGVGIMDIKKVKEAYKIYDNAFAYMQRIKALIKILGYEEANYPSNFLLKIALRDIKSAGRKLSKCSDILVNVIMEEKKLRKQSKLS